jgi:uncharacterized protein YbjT (DUF2867 family)
VAVGGAPAFIIWEMRILVTGASGFVGSLLIPRLRREEHAVRAMGRDEARVQHALAQTCPTQGAATVEVVRGDALSGEGLDRALAGVQVAYYLIHSMESSPSESPSSFALRERIAAENFGAAAARAGIRRIVYLGGLVPRWSSQDGVGQRAGNARTSRHLASRSEVERILLEAVADSLALRASIVIGAHSRSFRLMVRLVERLPVLTLPAWHRFQTKPIDARDIIEMLTACAGAQVQAGRLEVGGPDVLSYGEMLTRIAELMLISRPALRLGVNLTGFTARVAAAIAGEDPDLVLPLMEGLQGDLLPAEDHAAELLNVRLHSFDAAVEHALGEWERYEQLAAR